MKILHLLLLSIFYIQVLPLIGHQHQPMKLNIEHRLNQIDSSLLLRQYEQLKMHAFEARLKLDLLSLEPHQDSRESKQRKELFSQRAKKLEAEAAKIRSKVLEMAVQSGQDHSRSEVNRQANHIEEAPDQKSSKKSGCKKSECKSKKGKQKK